MDRTAYRAFLDMDRRHFWRKGKRELVLETIERVSLGRTGLRILDIGGACSLITRELTRFGAVTCVEPDEEMLALAQGAPNIRFIKGGLPKPMPVEGPYDLVTLFDVLEHIDDEAGALREIQRLLAPGGSLVMTVPALKWLWSDHDVSLHHKRRYERPELKELLNSAGFAIDRLSFHSSLIFPALASERLLRKVLRAGRPENYRVAVPPPWLNVAFGTLMRMERLWIRFLDLPIGSSLLVIGHKED